MQRLLHIVLAFSILVTQSAWAMHGDDLENENSTPGYSQETEQHDELTDACNHLCHASSHLVGLFSNSNLDVYVSRDGHLATLKNVSKSYNEQPSIPPPIS